MKLTGIHIFVILLFVLITTCCVTNWCQSSTNLVEGAIGNMSNMGMRNRRNMGRRKHRGRGGKAPWDSTFPMLLQEGLQGMEGELKYDKRMTSELLNESKSNHSKENNSDSPSNYLPGVPTPKGNIIPGVPNPQRDSRPSPQSHQRYPNQVPKGEEDMYILKSEIVPPVCPACPSSASCPRGKPCPPCPAPARCPEPSFECKKVPNYQGGNTSTYLPKPVLTDFSQFGI